MKLRKLETKDAPYMLEWMHDKSVVENMHEDFLNKNIEDCVSFIIKSQNDPTNIHLAIVNDEDEYQGTVSLKNVESEKGEFAIAIRSSAMGKGYSHYAMNKIFEIGFRKLNLKEIYWCVASQNLRAIKFYEKCGYSQIPKCRIHDAFIQNISDVYLWYQVKRSDVYA